MLKYYGYGKDAGNWRITNHPRLLGDVNGDGMVDIVGFATDGVMLSLSTGSGFNSGWRTDKHLRYLADADGDGMVDTVGFGDDGVYVLLSTGSNFTSPVLEVNDFGAHLDINCLLEVGI